MDDDDDCDDNNDDDNRDDDDEDIGTGDVAGEGVGSQVIAEDVHQSRVLTKQETKSKICIEFLNGRII